MDADDIKRYRMKLKYAERGWLDRILGELLEELDDRPFPEALLPTFIEAYRKEGPHCYIKQSGLVKIVADTKSSELYELCKQRDALGDWELAHLLATCYPDPEIEKTLAAELYKIFRKDAQPLKKQIVEAMAINGGTISLELLEQINLELADSTPVRGYELNNALPTDTPEEIADKGLEKLALDAEKSFRNDVNSAMVKIKQRLENR
jgi:hypothetical protein